MMAVGDVEGVVIEALPDRCGRVPVVDPPDRLLELPRSEPPERRSVRRRLHELPDVVVGAEHQRHQRRARPQPGQVRPERIHPLGLHPFVPEDPSVDERLRRNLADDARLFVLGRTQAIDVEGGLRESLEEVGVEQPPQGRDVRVVQRGRVDLLSLRSVLGRPRDVQPGVRTLGEDLGSLFTREGIVHRRDDVVRPFGPNDPGGERDEGAHPAVSRNAAMNPTRASTPSSVIAL